MRSRSTNVIGYAVVTVRLLQHVTKVGGAERDAWPWPRTTWDVGTGLRSQEDYEYRLGVEGLGLSRYDEVKRTGAHYTPPELASFLAGLALDAAGPTRRLSVLDPACGDGSLLSAIADVAGARRARNIALTGFDSNSTAVEETTALLAGRDGLSTTIESVDFLDYASGLLSDQGDLFSSAPADGHGPERFDLIIANPPYVRTQVLGADESQRLASALGLSGRVDLYHAFVRAMTVSLRTGGALALLCSNRFIYTLAGASVRRMLSKDYELDRVIDLGDTKLFEAAVLPAIVVAKKSTSPKNDAVPFSRVYEIREEADEGTRQESVLSALESGVVGPVNVGGVRFRIEAGVVEFEGDSPWVLASDESREWLERVAEHTAATFGDLAKIRVGIKTTADKVFIRSDWDEMEAEDRPEPELLQPLLTHYVADRWKGSAPTARVLYPHEAIDGRRRPVDIDDYPKARRYLLGHRERLEGRKYVIEAGRKWYELWVPQSPEDWSKPKLVCPDISESPRFFLDASGAVVNGDCYWITLKPGQDAGWLKLILAVANSSFAVKFYDTVCGNKLYSGRRRFITQYIRQFPVPSLDAPNSGRIIDIVSELTEKPNDDEHTAALEAECDRLVSESLGGIK